MIIQRSLRRGTARAPYRHIALLTYAMVMLAHVAHAEQVERPTHSRLSIRLYDYVCVPPARLEIMKREVARLYSTVGVDVQWVEPRRFRENASARSAPTHPRPVLAVIVITSTMADQLTLPPTALGVAPGTTIERGHVAYIVYDRVQRLAVNTRVDVDLTAVVVAHEIGHLLLPYGAHSPTGVMRGEWDARALRQLDARALTFTPAQGEQIRQRVFGAVLSVTEAAQ